MLTEHQQRGQNLYQVVSLRHSANVYIYTVYIINMQGIVGCNDVIWVCRRHGAACCCVAGLVYALGGFDGQTVLNSAERFDPARRGLHDQF